jgi:hypothetical protein
MEKLSRRSDGYAETPSGLFAIAPKAITGVTADGTAWFKFRASVLSEPVRVEWPNGAPVVAVDQNVALIMLRNRYAQNVTDKQIDDYNNLVDEVLAADKKAAKPVEKEKAEGDQKPAETPKEETPPEGQDAPKSAPAAKRGRKKAV